MSKRAFSLIEILIVCAILAGYVGLLAPMFSQQAEKEMKARKEGRLQPFFPADQEIEFLKRRVHLLEVAYESMDRRISLLEGPEKHE